MIQFRYKFSTVFLMASLFLPLFNGSATEVSPGGVYKIVVPVVRVNHGGALSDNAVDQNKCLKNIFEAQVGNLNSNKTLSAQLNSGENLIFSVEDSGKLFGFFHRYFLVAKGKSMKNFFTLADSKPGQCRYKTNGLGGALSEDAFTLNVAAR